MRVFAAGMAVMVAGCAGQPNAPEPAARTTFVASVPVIATAVSSDGKTPSVSKTVLDAKKMGYTVVDENGEKMFCRKAARTGSHLATETTCLTAKQIDELREQTQRSLQYFQMQMPPPQGK
jgi:hypothetical protein